MSTPHPRALGKQLKTDDDQYERMGYMRSIQDHPEGVARTLLRDDGKKLVELYGGAVPDDLAASYVARFSEPGAFLSVLKYYQAMDGRDRTPSTPITVPTSFIWAARDIVFSRTTAELSARYVEGPFSFVPSRGRVSLAPRIHTRTTSLPRSSTRHGNTRRISSVQRHALPHCVVPYRRRVRPG